MTTTSTAALAAPFRGLAPFDESELDALLFFGRERETEVAVANLLAARLTILYGPSGVGKSSVLRAGVARRIRELAARRAIGRGPDGAVVVVAAWADDPVAAIADAVATEVGSLVRRRVEPPAPGTSLADVVAHWSAVLDGDLYLVLDQLEEHFVYHEDAVGAGTLVAELPEVVLRPRLRANVLLSLRDDALAQLDVFKASIPNLFANYLRLDRLDPQAATAAILGPLQRWNDLVPAEQRVDIEPELVDAVLAQAAVAGEPDRIEPPYLQLVMERLWNEELETGSRVLRAETLSELGGAGAIVREHLDRALAVLDGREQDAAARMFEHLVTPSGTKVAHRASDLAEFGRVPVEEATPVLATLGRERILRPLDEGSGAGDRYEIFHDVLAGAILDWRRRREIEHERVVARRRQRRLVAIALLACVGLVAMAAVAIFAISKRSEARHQARHARAGELSAQALLLEHEDPQASLGLALAAARLEPSAQREEVLRSSLLAARLRKVLPVRAPAPAVAFSPGGRLVAIGTTAGVTRIWDTETNRVVHTLRGDGPVRSVAYDAAGDRTLTAGRRAVVWSARSGREVVVLAADQAVDAVFSRGDRDVITAGPLGLAEWRVRDGRPVLHFQGSRDDVRVVVSVRGSRVAALGGDGRGHVVPSLYDGFSGRLIRSLPQPGGRDLAFSSDGRLLATSSADGSTVVWNARDGRRLRAFDDDGTDVDTIAFSPDGSLLATGSEDGGVRVWHVATGDRFFYFLGHTNPVTDVRFDPSGRYVVSTSADGTARLSAVAGIEAGTLVGVLAGSRGGLLTAAYAPDGTSVVTGGADGTARLWDAHIEQTLRTVARVSGTPIAVATVGHDGLLADRVGATVDVRRGRHEVGSLTQAGDVVAFSSRGLVAVARGLNVSVRRIPSGSPVAGFATRSQVVALSFRADAGELVAATSGGAVVAWDLRSRRQVHRFAAERGMTAVAISPNGDDVLTGGSDHVARLWSASGVLRHTLSSDGLAITDARFDPTGTRVVTASEGTLGNAIEWDARSGALLHVLVGHFGTVTAISFSQDGRWILTAGPVSAAVWFASTGERLFYLRGHTDLLTDAEWASTGYTIFTTARDHTIRRYVCDVCRPLQELVTRAEARLAAAR
jgi:WD40 repeat protein